MHHFTAVSFKNKTKVVSISMNPILNVCPSPQQVFQNSLVKTR